MPKDSVKRTFKMNYFVFWAILGGHFGHDARITPSIPDQNISKILLKIKNFYF